MAAVIPQPPLTPLHCASPAALCVTGPCRLYSVNCNHGPSTSEWYAVAPEHVPKLQAAVLRESGLDITAGGCWFPSLEFCERNHIPVMFGLQQPGDVVVLDGAWGVLSATCRVLCAYPAAAPCPLQAPLRTGYEVVVCLCTPPGIWLPSAAHRCASFPCLS